MKRILELQIRIDEHGDCDWECVFHGRDLRDLEICRLFGECDSGRPNACKEMEKKIKDRARNINQWRA